MIHWIGINSVYTHILFIYLKCVGKLADMYGEEPSDTDSNVDADEGWRIWRSNLFFKK
jgi:hypothetical protein